MLIRKHRRAHTLERAIAREDLAKQGSETLLYLSARERLTSRANDGPLRVMLAEMYAQYPVYRPLHPPPRQLNLTLLRL